VPIITVKNLTDWLGIADTVDDTNLAIAVAATNDSIAGYCGRVFDKTETPSIRYFRPRSPYTVDVDDFWTTAGLIVATDAGNDGVYENTWQAINYSVEPINGLKGGAPWSYETIRATRTMLFPNWFVRPSVAVTASWGWAAIPDAVFNAALIQASRIFRRKDSPEGILGSRIAAGFDAGPVRIAQRLDPDVQHLLGPYVKSSTVVGIA